MQIVTCNGDCATYQLFAVLKASVVCTLGHFVQNMKSTI